MALPPIWAVAAGILPAVEPGILPGGMAVPHSHTAPPGRQDAALYGRQDARRYVVAVTSFTLRER